MNAKQTEKEFIQNFIRKERRERSAWLLRNKKKRTQFIDKFNHNWTDMISEKHLIELNAKSDPNTYEKIKAKIKLKDSDLCYVISYDENDGEFIDLKTAFGNSQANGFASLIIGADGKKFYLKTEQEIGAPKEFVGKI